MGAMETLLARIGATQNPGHLVAQGVNKITTPGYPADDALRGYVAGAPAFQPTIGGMLKQTGTDLASSGTGFLKSLMAGDYEAAMNSSLFPLGAMTVYHGSPHKFDAFDLSKIGTGEGAQAYGHGLYFAENPGVAGSYAENLAKDPRDELTGLLKDLRNPLSGYVTATKGEIAEALSKHPILGPIVAANPSIADEARKIAYGMNKDGTVTSEAMKAFGRLEKVLPPPSKNLYHVDIPDDEIAKMLDWDKPLSEQPESVKSLLRGSEIAPDESVWSQYTGQQLYEGEMQAGGPYKGSGWAGSEAQKAVSEKLRKLGIPGIKYLDSGSRFTSGAELIGVWRGDQKVMADKASGEWFARVGKKSSDVNGPVTGMVTSPPMKSAEAAKEWADSKIAGGSRNIVLFDDKLAKVLKRE